MSILTLRFDISREYSYSLTFNASGLKPGIYFLSLKANGSVEGVSKVVVY